MIQLLSILQFSTRVEPIPLFLIVVFFLLVGIFYYLRQQKLAEELNKAKLVKTEIKGLPRILAENLIYYQNLSRIERKEFELRVNQFIKEKQFIPINLSEVNLEMKVLIAGCAIQLTFGLSPLFLDYFNEAIIYPDLYAAGKRINKEEVNASGSITFSWKQFMEGPVTYQDFLNLGLYETTLAIKLQDKLLKEENSFVNESTVRRWEKLSDIELHKIWSDEPSYFKRYYSRNTEEFFAAAVESFFEHPSRLQEYNSTLYYTLRTILNQDPGSRI